MYYAKINKTKDYIFINRNGKQLHSDNFIIQYINKLDKSKTKECEVKFGITASKKIGNAVTRNLIKRRFRSMFNFALSNVSIKYSDYVIIGKKNIVNVNYKDLILEFNNAFKKINNSK